MPRMTPARGGKKRRPRKPGPTEVPVAPSAGRPALPLSRRRRFWFRLTTVCLSFLVLWGIPEAVVRLANPQLESFQGMLIGGDPNSPVLFMKDARLHWKLRPNVETRFLNTTVRTSRDGFRGTEPRLADKVALCLGDSTVFGYSVEESDAFPTRLQLRLRRQSKPGDAWSVINAGVPGYSSLQVRLQAEKLVPRWKPAVIILCVGNNEAWPVERSDRRIDEDRAASARLVSLLSASRLLVWTAERIRPEAPRPFMAPDLERAVPRVSKEEFGENLRAIAEIAREANARLILLGPPANIYWAPMRFKKFAGWEKWQTFSVSISQLVASGELQTAREKVDAALAESPDAVAALWLKGKLLTASGDVAGGRAFLEQAIERHPFPENCKPSYRDVVARLAREEGLSHIDVNELFRQHAPGPTPEPLYLDWCHPTPQGHGIIANALAELIGG
jgi:lysophospholipase L1-like esterase